MEIKDEKTVVETPEGAGSAPTTDNTPEDGSSQEVKTDVQETKVEPNASNVQQNDVEISKMQEQINNLNIALKKERDAGKAESQELKEQLARSQETIDKLKNVFSPEQREEVEQEPLTMDQIEELLDKREAKRQEEINKQTLEEKIKTEVKELESVWDGSDGKPKYDDDAVLKWQEDNSKMHLSPREAFNEMNRDAIIDWEVKNRLSSKPNVENVETPSGTPGERTPQEQKPVNTSDLRNAVLEAMGIADNN